MAEDAAARPNCCVRVCAPCGLCLAPCATQCRADHLDFKLDGQSWKTSFGAPSGFASCCSGTAFFATRVALLILWFAVTIWSTVDWVNSEDDYGDPYRYGFWWTQLTHWTVIFLLVYFGFAAYTTGMAQFSSVPDGTGDATPWFVSVTWAMQPAALVATFIVFVLYWGLLYDGGSVAVISCLTHGGNCGLAVLDMLLCRQPLYLAHVFMPIAYSLTYIIFSLIYYAAGGVNHQDLNSTRDRSVKSGMAGSPYIYSSLDWNDPGGTGNLAGAIVLVVVPVAWVGCFCLFLARRCRTASVAPKAMPV